MSCQCVSQATVVTPQDDNIENNQNVCNVIQPTTVEQVNTTVIESSGWYIVTVSHIA